MSYQVRVEQFEGPLDLLLQLIEASKLDISKISLAQITEPFLIYINEHRADLQPAELADFLLVGAKLLYCKARAMMPVMVDDTDEAGELVRQLEQYQVLTKIALLLRKRCESPQRLYGPANQHLQPLIVSLTTQITGSDLHEAIRRCLKRLQPFLRPPVAFVERVLSLDERIAELRHLFKDISHTSMGVLRLNASRAETVVTFLALLELMKQQVIKLKQTNLFEDISIQV